MNILNTVEDSDMYENLRRISLDDPNATAMIEHFSHCYPSQAPTDEEVVEVRHKDGKIFFLVDAETAVIVKRGQEYQTISENEVPEMGHNGTENHEEHMARIAGYTSDELRAALFHFSEWQAPEIEALSREDLIDAVQCMVV